MIIEKFIAASLPSHMAYLQKWQGQDKSFF